MPHLQGTFAHPADLQTMSMQDPQDVASPKKAMTSDASCTCTKKSLTACSGMVGKRIT